MGDVADAEPPALALPNPGSYTVHPDGTVTDDVTGLMWQQAVDALKRAWADASSYCAGLDLAGHCDWRLPSRIELASLVDVSRIDPSIEADVFPDTPTRTFWASSPLATIPMAAWAVDFAGGRTVNTTADREHDVRCVRSGLGPMPLPHYEVRDGVVRDTATGLEWSRATAGPVSWDVAVAHCAGLDPTATTQWRVPSVKELQTLIDETRTNPSIDLTFPGTPVEAFWALPELPNTGARAWQVTFGAGSSDRDGVASRFIRCVR